ncbi:MAG TPA: WXG100 family type VII secretion target [Micromonosporaceae bacterium]|nr:WXG100 family type VII secretion target [Micromonosporaceae bacterium]
MDLLDRVYPVASDLLARVDQALLTLGAPPNHPIWTVMRTVGATPSDAAAHLMGLDAEQLTDAAQSVTASMSEWHDIVAGLPRSIDSQGVAAEAYINAWPGIAAHLDDLAGGLDEASAFLRATADWIARSRRSLAGTLASCLGSREALTLRSAAMTGTDHATIVAAADIGAQVLAMVAHCLDDGWQVRDRYASILAEAGRVDTGAAPTIRAGHRIDVR